MNTAELNDALQFARALAAQAGLQCARDFRQVEVNRKADDSEVTSTDLAIQSVIAERIRATYPEHALLGEEAVDTSGMPDPASARYCWIIDPLDGTRNFVRGLPCFCTSIALLENRAPVVGVIRDHAAGITYSATRGGGAHVAGRVMRVSASPLDSRAVVSFQPARRGKLYEQAAPWIRTVNVRSLGITAVHLALLADGALDAAVCEECYIWDVAAGALMIEEAGGVITDPNGRPLFPFDLAKSPRCHVPFTAGGEIVHASILAAPGPR
jgi:myo-inositol-1(or 4)-monophosphatase